MTVHDSNHGGELPANIQMMRLATQYWEPQMVFAATKLGLAEELANGPKSVAELAKKVGAKPDLLMRLLRGCASIGVFAEDDQGRYGHTPLSDVLRKDHPQSAWGMVMMENDEWLWNSWGGLYDAIKTGEVAFTKIYKKPFFEAQSQDPEREKAFAAAMTNLSHEENRATAKGYDFNALGTVVDVGGGNGHLLAAIVREHTKIKGILYDLTGVIDSAIAMGHVTAPDIKHRIELQRGSMLESVPKGADAYVFKNVVHDWDDEHAITMLKHCRDAMAPNGRVLLVESVIKPGNQRDHVKLLDICMFLLFNGSERNEEQYRSLCARAGLRVERVIPLASGQSIVEAVKA